MVRFVIGIALLLLDGLFIAGAVALVLEGEVTPFEAIFEGMPLFLFFGIPGALLTFFGYRAIKRGRSAQRQNGRLTEAVHPEPAGFWIRVLATLIDVLVLSPVGALSFINLLYVKSLLLLFVLQLPWLLYKPLMEALYGATLGKMALKIRVIDTHGNNLTLSKAYIRFLLFLAPVVVSFAALLSLFLNPGFEGASSFEEIYELTLGNPLYSLSSIAGWVVLIDVVVVAFTRRKRAIHDMMAGSFCVYRATTSSNP